MVQRNADRRSLLSVPRPTATPAKPRPDPWRKVEAPAARDDADPQRQLRAVDGQAEDFDVGLEEQRREREEVAGGVDAYEEEADAAHRAVRVDVPVVPEHARGEQRGRDHGRERDGPRRAVRDRLLQGEQEGGLGGAHESGNTNQIHHALAPGPTLAVVAALALRDKAQQSEDVCLDAQCHVEFLHDVVRAEGDAGGGPQKHHGRLEARRVVPR